MVSDFGREVVDKIFEDLADRRGMPHDFRSGEDWEEARKAAEKIVRDALVALPKIKVPFESILPVAVPGPEGLPTPEASGNGPDASVPSPDEDRKLTVLDGAKRDELHAKKKCDGGKFLQDLIEVYNDPEKEDLPRRFICRRCQSEIYFLLALAQQDLISLSET